MATTTAVPFRPERIGFSAQPEEDAHRRRMGRSRFQFGCSCTDSRRHLTFCSHSSFRREACLGCELFYVGQFNVLIPHPGIGHCEEGLARKPQSEPVDLVDYPRLRFSRPVPLNDLRGWHVRRGCGCRQRVFSFSLVHPPPSFADDLFAIGGRDLVRAQPIAERI